MSETVDWRDEKQALHGYLRRSREALLWKLYGLSEYDARRPMTPTGTNLLGLVKHVAAMAAGYFGDCFGRPDMLLRPDFADDAEPNADMFAAADETREQVLSFWHEAWERADETIDRLPLDAMGSVPWWPPERRDTTLHRLLVHMVEETARHTGHADILRELIDGGAGRAAGTSNMPEADDAWWVAYRERLEQIARDA